MGSRPAGRVGQPSESELLRAVSTAPHARLLAQRTPALLALYRLDRPAQARAIAEQTGIPLRTLHRHFSDLQGYGAVHLDTRRGASGSVAGAVQPIEMWTTQGKLVLDLQPLVLQIAKRQALRLPRWVPLSEHVQNGQIGLLQAAKRYNPFSGVPFQAFARQRITGAIIDAYRRRNYDFELHEEIPESYDESVPSDQEEVVAASQRRTALESAIGLLPEHLAEAARTYLREETLRDFAARVGITEPAACTRRQEAMEELRRILAGLQDAL